MWVAPKNTRKLGKLTSLQCIFFQPDRDVTIPIRYWRIGISSTAIVTSLQSDDQSFEQEYQIALKSLIVLGFFSNQQNKYEYDPFFFENFSSWMLHYLKELKYQCNRYAKYTPTTEDIYLDFALYFVWFEGLYRPVIKCGNQLFRTTRKCWSSTDINSFR
jgi:hypothetical protein